MYLHTFKIYYEHNGQLIEKIFCKFCTHYKKTKIYKQILFEYKKGYIKQFKVFTNENEQIKTTI